jgi:hypothetical protein
MEFSAKSKTGPDERVDQERMAVMAKEPAGVNSKKQLIYCFFYEAVYDLDSIMILGSRIAGKWALCKVQEHYFSIFTIVMQLAL